MIEEYLDDSGFRVSGAGDGEALARLIDRDLPDLVILDLKLEREDGLDLMRGLAERSGPPIIVITGHRREEADRILGLELGADDYMTKPFSMRELLARVRAVLRRAEIAGQRARSDGRRARYRFAGWELDMRSRRLTAASGEAVPLTAGEFNLLTAFLRSPRHVLSRDQLLEATKLHEEEVFDRSIDVQILRLRRKLEADPSDPRLILTERGAGYIFTAPVETV
jgi:DNA-binding response OmpR family regulator